MPIAKITQLVKILPFITVMAQSYQWPSPQYDALETTLYEGISPTGDTVAVLTSDCNSRNGIGPPVAAEWLRLAYHDMATHNATDGTGGLDASIYYEYNRPENVGDGNFNTLVDLRGAPSTLVSRADIIAMGAVWGVASCGGPPLAFHGGRIDALEPGRFGVPQPQETLETHILEFKLQGFTQTEMISLVACGHSIGGVRTADFPDIVPSSEQSLNDTVGASFDSTVEAYDFNVVSEYLKGTTKNPLIVATNTSLQSDLKIFSSDRNVTIKRMNSPESYRQTCKTLLERMLNTVPSHVQLTEEIAFLPFKVRTAEITVVNGTLVFHVHIRVQFPTGVAQTVTMLWCDRRGPDASCANGQVHIAAPADQQNFPLLSPLSVALGINVTQFDFTIPLSSASLQRFWFEVGDSAHGRVVIEDNGGTGYVLQQDTLIAHTEFLELLGDPQSPSDFVWTMLVGVLNGTASTAPQVHITDVAVPFKAMVKGVTPTIPPPVDTMLTLSLNTSMQAVGGYTFYSGFITGQQTTMFDVSVTVGGEHFEIVHHGFSNFDDLALSVVSQRALAHKRSENA